MKRAYRRGADRNEGAPAKVPHVDPDYSSFDTPEAIIRDAAKWGILDELRELLCGPAHAVEKDALRIARDIAFELAGAKDRSRAVDVFLQATGIAEYEAVSLRDYAARHGVSHEWFRREVEAMRRRLNLPASGRQDEYDDAA